MRLGGVSHLFGAILGNVVTKQVGDQGEELVAQRLLDDGFIIVARNYRQQYGEIDIIAARAEVLAFVEVKVRARSPFGLDHLVPPAKQRKIGMVAREFLSSNNIIDKVCQFDVALIEHCGDHCGLTYIENAFTCDE